MNLQIHVSNNNGYSKAFSTTNLSAYFHMANANKSILLQILCANISLSIHGLFAKSSTNKELINAGYSVVSSGKLACFNLFISGYII